MTHVELVAFTIAITVVAYAASRHIHLKSKSAFLNPVVLSTAVIIAMLVTLGISAEQYGPGKEIMTSLLGPATVALAVQLYRNRHVLVTRWVAVGLGIVSGSVVTMSTVVELARGLGLERTIVVSLAPKSATTPIAIEIARTVGGNPSVTVAFVIATGMLGAMLGPGFLTLVGVRDPVARGVAMGTTSHGQGTAMILLEGETQGAMSGIAMALTAVVTAVIAPVLIPLLVNLGG